MEERKQTKGTVFSWTLIGLAFVGIMLFFLFKFLSEGKSNAISQSQNKLINDAEDWSYMLNTELSATDYFGKMLVDMEENGNRFGGAIMQEFAQSIVKETYVSHILFCDGTNILCDENGNKVSGFDISGYVSDTVTHYALNRSVSVCEDPEVITIVPVADSTHRIILCMDFSEIEKQFTVSSYEEVSFVVLINREGDIFDCFSKGKDLDSMFINNGNLFSCVSQGCSGKNTFSMFKTRFLNGLNCAVESQFRGDRRTIAFSKVGLEDMYIAYGVRQSYVDRLIDTHFDSIRNTVIRLAIVVVVFAVFIISTIVFNTLRSKERGRVLEDKADTDLLTELNNKAATERKIQEYLETNPNGRAMMFILDIDNFKKINDTMGHAFGDTLLKTLGKEIKTEFRVTDIIGRTGGDEFMVFLKDVNDDMIIEREANRITRFFHDFKAGGDYVKYSATASIGAAIYPDDAKSFKDLYVAADQALYKAKKRGKNQLVFYNEERRNK